MDSIRKFDAPSNSSKPDLDWSQIRETVLMLNVAVAQIDNTLHCGDESVNSLAESFTSMVNNVDMIRQASDTLEEGETTDTIMLNCSEVSQKMHAAIIAFQFYDKLTQRLSHLSNSLGDLSELVSTPQKLYDPVQWKTLQDQIKSKYTVESDKAMFESILEGKTVQEVLEYQKTLLQQANKEPDEDVELF